VSGVLHQHAVDADLAISGRIGACADRIVELVSGSNPWHGLAAGKSAMPGMSVNIRLAARVLTVWSSTTF